MKARYYRTRLKEKESTETSPINKTRRSTQLRRLNQGNSNSKLNNRGVAKAKLKQTSSNANLLPDQQSEEDLYYAFKPCCVKIQRLKSILPKEVNKTLEEIENTPSVVHNPKKTSSTIEYSTVEESGSKGSNTDKNIRPCFVKMLRRRSGEGTTSVQTQGKAIHLSKRHKQQDSNMKEASDVIVETIKERSEEQAVDLMHESQANTKKNSTSVKENRYSFRNPALALTRRKAEQKGLYKTTAKGSQKNNVDKTSTANNCTIDFEPNTNSSMHVPSISSPKKIDSPTANQENFPQKKLKTRSKATLPKAKNKKLKTTSPKKVQSGRSKEDDVYEFLSQSQSNSDSDKRDPAADIIKKLIKQGKVTVTKNYKGKPVTAHRKRNKTTALKRLKTLQKNPKSTLVSKKVFQPKEAVIEEVVELDDIYADFENPVLTEADPLPIAAPVVVDKTVKGASNTLTSAATNQGTFSDLARSVLMHQTNNSNIERRKTFDRRRLLEITRRHVSTPLRKASPLTNPGNLSPIPKITTDNSIGAIDFENNLSYRPSLPHIEHNTSIRNESVKSNRTLRNTRYQSSLSSFSSNDSNAENVPPAAARANTTVTQDENALIFDARQIPNPRRALQNRSPLKQINIIDVITLPPYKGPSMKDKDYSKRNAVLQTNLDLHVDSNNDERELQEESVNNEEDQALFGFEEYLDKEDQNVLNEESIKNTINDTSNSVCELHNKLKELKKWRPDVTRYKRTKSSTITKQIFDDDFSKTKGHHDIRNFLCSTMINASGKNENTTMASLSDSSGDNDATTSKRNAELDLFGDPESTFDQEKLHRTYERPFKRKRKLLHQYSVALDSEDENETDDDHNVSFTKKTKRHNENRLAKNDDKELEEFVSNFNSQIKEAEEYTLIVE